MDLHQWRRGPRSGFTLGPERGVYALFLRHGAQLAGITPGEAGLLYVGLAANRQGLKGRCHFNAQTRNHSPRKSLAILLMEELGLEPVLFPKPNSRHTWGLAMGSEVRLTAWMHQNLDLAIYPCADPKAIETSLIQCLVPPLNLAKCFQSPNHRRISAARAEVMSCLESRGISAASAPRSASGVKPSPDALDAKEYRPTKIVNRHPGSLDSAEAIAAHYGLNPKSYRQRLRKSISWYRKPQNWAFPPGSPEWRDMISIAEEMEGTCP